MNDFTKEELEYLKWLVKDYEGEYQNSVTALPEKIQSMIDNFEKDQEVKESLNKILEKAREWRMEL